MLLPMEMGAAERVRFSANCLHKTLTAAYNENKWTNKAVKNEILGENGCQRAAGTILL